MHFLLTSSTHASGFSPSTSSSQTCGSPAVAAVAADEVAGGAIPAENARAERRRRAGARVRPIAFLIALPLLAIGRYVVHLPSNNQQVYVVVLDLPPSDSFGSILKRTLDDLSSTRA
mmetsp:Transcript_22583/g.50223  ORF Transcript_22583/g.50223 Transcript_22583/m.50223 type:complete len:117 (-) Transcript_22583:88-438(-)